MAWKLGMGWLARGPGLTGGGDACVRRRTEQGGGREGEADRRARRGKNLFLSFFSWAVTEDSKKATDKNEISEAPFAEERFEKHFSLILVDLQVLMVCVSCFIRKYWHIC